MTDETFYRMMHDAKLPCQHCGKGIRIYDMMVEGYGLRDGRVRTNCPECGGSLPQMMYRDYGVHRPSYSAMSGFPVAGSAKHFSIHTFNPKSNDIT